MTANKNNPKNQDIQAQYRKDSHLDLAKTDAALAHITHPLDSVILPHYALPQLHLDEIDIRTYFCGKLVQAPFYIGAMTGGTERADKINLALAKSAQESGIGFAIGSQRASLAAGRDMKHIRQIAPDIPIIGNLGITQLARPDGMDMAKRAIESLDADAMAIHLNPLQEAAQLEGDRDWRGTFEALQRFITDIDIAVIVKEVGAGIHPKLAKELHALGAVYIDIAALGGTNWTRIETLRRADGDRALFAPFLDWGIDLVSSLKGCRESLPDARLIASGGIRHGLDVAKTLYLGADMSCAAGPFLRAIEADDGSLNEENLIQLIEIWKSQIQLACFLTNSQNLQELRKI